MAANLMNPILDHLRRVVLLPDRASLADAQLLESFVSQKDEAAFEVLVRRHGPMVLGVCRRVLGNPHDAEDAFQATFLVLLRKPGSIVPRERVANWLYGVAYRTALKARALLARQRARERPGTEMPEPEVAGTDHGWPDWQPLLDQELSRLPDRYRVPIVLCDLEGKTGKDAARQLGWPEGTVASRLSRGRALLAKRLTRHGLALSSGALTAVLSENAASASVPASLVSSTVKAASFLAAGQALTTGLVSARVGALLEGVIQAMFLSKAKIALVLLAVISVVGIGWGGMSFLAVATDAPVVQRGQQEVSQSDRKQAEKPGQGNSTLSSDDLRGNWTGEKNGIKVDLTFHGEKARWQAHWQVDFKVTRKQEHPVQSPIRGYNKGAALSCVADVKTGVLNLYLPRYLGDNKEFKQNPSFNGLRAVGQVQRGPEGTLQLRIVPTGYQDAAIREYDYPAIDGLILRRVSVPNGPEETTGRIQKIEIHRAESDFAEGLTPLTEPGTNRKVHLHPKAELTNEDIAKVRVVEDDSRWVVEITFTRKGLKRAAALSEHQNKPIAILIGGKLISAPVLRTKIVETMRITGGFTRAEAEELAKTLDAERQGDAPTQSPP